MPDNLESHVIIIIGEAQAMKNLGAQIEDYAGQVNTRHHNGEFSPAEVNQLETAFNSLIAVMANIESNYAATDTPIGEIESVLGI